MVKTREERTIACAVGTSVPQMLHRQTSGGAAVSAAADVFIFHKLN